MRVTAYSPDAQSCGEFADGLTATMHPVTTNRGMLVAADQRMFPYGSLLSIPGYDEGRIVPVLDCGGAIKGNRLDVLFPTHEAALEWGVKELEVVVWEAVDGLALDDPREIR
jgi:3D (Asp-Asp-Asp) domain-containing protein